MKDIFCTFSVVVMRAICVVKSICKPRRKYGEKKHRPVMIIIRLDLTSDDLKAGDEISD